MARDIYVTKVGCAKCGNQDIEQVGDFKFLRSSVLHDRVTQSLYCEKCGWVGLGVYYLTLIYMDEDG